jgi:DNA-binding Lrp family transcriptional regulator
MAAAAYVFVNCDIRMVAKVLKQIRQLKKYVRQAHSVAGIYDIIAFVEAGSLEELTRVVLNELQAVEGIRSTVTMLEMPVE